MPASLKSCKDLPQRSEPVPTLRDQYATARWVLQWMRRTFPNRIQTRRMKRAAARKLYANQRATVRLLADGLADRTIPEAAE